MTRIIIREIGVLALSISIFPLAFLFLVFRGDINQYTVSLIYRELVKAGSSDLMSSILFLSRLLTPYLIVQAIRAYQWSKTGVDARRWANLYFALLCGIVGTWFVLKSFDLFYFMLELGDIPGELSQFLQLEYTRLTGAAVSFYLLIRSLRIFVSPGETSAPKD